MIKIVENIKIVNLSENVPIVSNFFKLENLHQSLIEKTEFIDDDYFGAVIHNIICDDETNIVSILLNFESSITKQDYCVNGSFTTVNNRTEFNGTMFPYLEDVTLSDFNFLVYLINEEFNK